MHRCCPCEPFCMSNMAKDFHEHLKNCKTQKRKGGEILIQDLISFKPDNLKKESVTHCVRGWQQTVQEQPEQEETKAPKDENEEKKDGPDPITIPSKSHNKVQASSASTPNPA